MHIVIPGALPPASVAIDLARAIEQDCPHLFRLFQQLTPKVVPLHPALTGCTPAEHVILELHGGLQQPGTRAVGALAAMHAGCTSPDETVWVAQMCAMSVGHDQVTLMLPEEIALLPEESARLMDDVLAVAPPSGFQFLPIRDHRLPHAWRVQFDAPIAYTSISPHAVRSMGVTDWWPQDPSTRTWRKWVNEAQMFWHAHPINEARMNRGLDVINGWWLYGGGPGWQPYAPGTDTLTLTHLASFHAQGEWAGWIRSLPILNEALALHPDIDALTLTGDARKVILETEQRSWWRSLLGTPKQTWSQWWNPQA